MSNVINSKQATPREAVKFLIGAMPIVAKLVINIIISSSDYESIRLEYNAHYNVHGDIVGHRPVKLEIYFKNEPADMFELFEEGQELEDELLKRLAVYTNIDRQEVLGVLLLK